MIFELYQMKYFPKIYTRTIGDIKIEGTSVSAYGTALGFPEMNFCIDIGVCPYSFITYENLLITHGHQDHLLELSRYVALRNMQKISPANIYVPEFLTKELDLLLNNWRSLESRRRHDYKLIPVKAGERYRFHGNYYFEPFKVFHSIPTFGYKIYEKRKKLKKEYHGLNSSELVGLKKKKIEIEESLWLPLIVHSSDTSAKFFSDIDFSDFKYLILESTFLLPEHEKTARDRKHLHIKDIVRNKDKIKNPFVLLTHFSMRYPDSIIISEVQKHFPAINKEKFFLLWENRNGS